MFYHNGSLSMYFGNADDRSYQAEYLALTDISFTQLIQHSLFQKKADAMRVQSLAFLHQTHSILGYTVTPQSLREMRAFAQDGDFLITNMPHVGLGVMTADCLPIIAYDERTHAIGIAHAGWRGSVHGIAPVMVARMQQEYGSNPTDLQIFFGPSGRACCYQVQPDFVEHLKPEHVNDTVLVRAGDKLFFDVAHYNALLLRECGVKPEAINTRFNVCTICDESFFSFRRQGAHAGRQMTVVAADNMTIATIV